MRIHFAHALVCLLGRSHLSFDANSLTNQLNTITVESNRVPYRYLTATSKYKFRLRICWLPLSMASGVCFWIWLYFAPTYRTLKSLSISRAFNWFYHFGTQTEKSASLWHKYTHAHIFIEYVQLYIQCSNHLIFCALMKLLFWSSIKISCYVLMRYMDFFLNKY